MGDANGRSKAIKNSNIRTGADAIAHVRNGGSLDRVPNQFWLEALKGNSSSLEVDPNSKYREIKPDAGFIGLTRIYVLRDAEGKTTDQGWVLKGAGVNDTAAEIGSQYLAIRGGFPVEAAGWDGKGRARRGNDPVPYAILPFALNGVENGTVRTGPNSYSASIFNDLPDKAHPERVAHLMHNWLMGVSDRNNGNGMTYRIGNKAYVIPIDQGWAGREVTDSPWRYSFRMDSGLQSKVTTHLSGLSPAERKRQARAIIETYDEMLDNAEKVVAEGRTEFIRNTLNGVSSEYRDSARQRLEAVYDVYEGQVRKMRTRRSAILQDIIPNTDHDLIR
jgi:hypothetical protein